MVIVAVCFVGRQNEPLSIRVYGGEDELSMQFAAYASLDFIDEKAHTQQQTAGVYSADSYFGYLCPALCLLNDYRVYGYLGCTGFKIILTLQDRDTYHDSEIRMLFRQLHRVYADAVCNPFLLDSIETPQFIKRLDNIVAQASRHLESSDGSSAFPISGSSSPP